MQSLFLFGVHVLLVNSAEPSVQNDRSGKLEPLSTCVFLDVPGFLLLPFCASFGISVFPAD